MAKYAGLSEEASRRMTEAEQVADGAVVYFREQITAYRTIGLSDQALKLEAVFNRVKEGFNRLREVCLMDRPKPGVLSIRPLDSSESTIWCTDGGVTAKYRSISASAGARPLSFV